MNSYEGFVCCINVYRQIMYETYNIQTSNIFVILMFSLLHQKIIQASVSWPSSGPAFCVVWLLKLPASGWGSHWESSSFVPWIVPYAFRDVSGEVEEWTWISGFMRKSSRKDRASKMQFSVQLNSWDKFLWLYPQFLWELVSWSLLVIWEHLRFVPSSA